MDSIQSKGGQARAAKLNAAERSDIASRAAKARWADKGPGVNKTIRIDPDLWAWVASRAALRKVSPSEWFVRLIADTKKRLEAEAK